MACLKEVAGLVFSFMFPREKGMQTICMDGIIDHKPCIWFDNFTLSTKQKFEEVY